MTVFMVRANHQSPWIYYQTWFVWRWGQRFPEDISFRTNPDVQHREASA